MNKNPNRNTHFKTFKANIIAQGMYHKTLESALGRSKRFVPAKVSKCEVTFRNEKTPNRSESARGFGG